MNERTDHDLVASFSEHGCERSFAALVDRHVPLVYSVAARNSVNAGQAQEITQAVFILFASKAASLRRNSVIAGWLYHAARNTAANFRRAEIRRLKREQESYMQSLLEQTSDPQPSWDELSPVLEEAMGKLSDAD